MQDIIQRLADKREAAQLGGGAADASTHSTPKAS